MAESIRRIILLGPPGAGKGTQALAIVEALKIPHISTGNMLREEIQRKSELGMKAQSYISDGKLVPDDVVNGIVAERLAREEDGYLLDGYPRTTAQAESLKNSGNTVDAVILIDADDENLIERIVGRLNCSQCTCVYHRTYNPPCESGKCDACGAPLKTREDDNEEVVRNRLKVYHNQTASLIDYYSELGLLRRVDGNRSPSDVRADLMRLLGIAV